MNAIVLGVALVLLLPSIPADTPIEGWPKLAVTKHFVSTKEVGDACPFGCPALGCTRYDLDRLTCDVYVSIENPSWPNLLEHELGHCEGREHVWSPPACGSGDSMRDVFERWKARKAADAKGG